MLRIKLRVGGDAAKTEASGTEKPRNEKREKFQSAWQQQVLAKRTPDAEGRVALSVLIRNVVNTLRHDLSTLLTALPSYREVERRRALMTHFFRARQVLLKLAVVIAWSKRDAQMVEAVNTTVHELQKRWSCVKQAAESVDRMTQAASMAMLPNFDLSTAADILSMGTYLRLPTTISRVGGGFGASQEITEKELDSRLEREALIRILRSKVPSRLKVHIGRQPI